MSPLKFTNVACLIFIYGYFHTCVYFLRLGILDQNMTVSFPVFLYFNTTTYAHNETCMDFCNIDSIFSVLDEQIIQCIHLNSTCPISSNNLIPSYSSPRVFLCIVHNCRKKCAHVLSKFYIIYYVVFSIFVFSEPF